MSSSSPPDNFIIQQRIISDTKIQNILLKKSVSDPTVTIYVPVFVQNYEKVNGSWVQTSIVELPQPNETN